MTDVRALIAGGGIGGLTSALCLARKGVEVVVLEQSRPPEEAGAGIQLSPNCTRVLHDVGLETSLREHAFMPVDTQFRHWRTGRVISESPLGESAVKRYGAPYYHVHRGDLLQVLLDAASDHASIRIEAGNRVTSITQQHDQVRVETREATYTGDFLVGADGIHSIVREHLFGPEDPRFTGNIAWRALVRTDRLPPDLIRPSSTVWWGPGKHFVHYFVRSGELVNCVCVVEKDGWEIESWTAKGQLSELRNDFSGWHRNIQQLLDQVETDSLYKWALFDREPMRHWGNGCITLLGDACHPTLPFMAQGAAMAIEDAAVLANCIASGADLPGALEHYEQLRRDRTAEIQRGSSRNAKVFHLSGLQAFLRNRAVRAAGSRAMDRLYNYNPLKLGSE